jgi:hypothetical protein
MQTLGQTESGSLREVEILLCGTFIFLVIPEKAQ